LEHKPSHHAGMSASAELLVVQHTAFFSPRSLRVQPCPREEALRTACTRYFYRPDAPLPVSQRQSTERKWHTHKQTRPIT